MIEIVVGWVLALTAATFVERQTKPPSPMLAASLGWLLFRIGVLTFIFAFFLVVSWRPYYAAGGTAILVAVMTAISNGKLAYTYEPLVVTDLAFIRDVFRHSELFHTTFLGPLVVLAAMAAIATITGLWFSFETPITVSSTVAMIAPLAWLSAALLPFLSRRIRRALAKAVLRLKTDPEVFRDIGTAGLMATLFADGLAWLGEDRLARIARWTSPRPRVRRSRSLEPADLIVAVQCESFMDMRRLTERAPVLPSLDEARRRARRWGPMGSAFAGGYTMRTEVSFLTGRAHRDLGFDRYYPYLNAAAYGSAAWPAALAAAGYETCFVHPFHRDFFQRHRAMPALGLARIIALEDFAGAEQVGPYVSDRAVGKRIIAEARAATGPAFIFAATMENHEPWCAGRFDGVSDPVEVYQRHVANGDALLGRLVDEFSQWPGRVVLAFYGDHVPLLKAFADPFPVTDTDYVLLELGHAAQAGSLQPARRLDVSELGWEMLRIAGMLDA